MVLRVRVCAEGNLGALAIGGNVLDSKNCAPWPEEVAVRAVKSEHELVSMTHAVPDEVLGLECALCTSLTCCRSLQEFQALFSILRSDRATQQQLCPRIADGTYVSCMWCMHAGRMQHSAEYR